jgi:myb proto-oncogene protein
VRVGPENWRCAASIVPGRTAKQCRERWVAHWAPENATEEWSPEEDLHLLENQAAMGNQWAKIKTALPGRSTVAVRNRWIWLCRRDIPRHTAELGELAKAWPLKAGENAESRFEETIGLSG